MDRATIFYGAASVAGFFTMSAHAFGGGALLARPFYEAAAVGGVRTQSFRFCWHFVTVSIAGVAAGFAHLATSPGNAPFGVFLTASAALWSALSVAVARIEDASPLKSPPTFLGALVAGFGAAALLAA